MKLHGKTTIELHDIKRNIKQIIRSENTFQASVLADYFRSYGEENTNPFDAGNYDGTSLWKNALGGLFLLKNPETVGNKFMSLGNVMIGNGAYGVSNSGSPNELGSYNSQESSESGSEIVQVYDFATNQANGQIGCVCLTSKVGGYIGYGNISGQYHSVMSYNFSSLQSTRGVVNCNRASASGNWLVNVSGNFSDGKIRITKTRRSLITGSVFNGFTKTLEFDLAEVGDGYNISGINTDCGCLKVYDVGNNKFRFVPFTYTSISVSANGTVYYYEFDAENDTLTQKSFTNSSSNSIAISISRADELVGVLFYGNYAFCVTSSVGHIAEILGASSGSFRRQMIYVLDGGWIAFNIDVAYNNPLFMYDTVNKTVYKINSGYLRVSNVANGLISNPSLGSGILDRIDLSPLATRTQGFVHNPLYLATINNLDSYVTKTANQTMKVTYTLTKE